MGNGPSQLVNSHEVLTAASPRTLYDCFPAASRGAIQINNISAERYERMCVKRPISKGTSHVWMNLEACGSSIRLSHFRYKVITCCEGKIDAFLFHLGV